MATFDRSFIDGVFWRMVAIGAALAFVVALFWSVRVGYSIALGALIGAASLRVTTVAVEGMLRAAVGKGEAGSGWGVLIAIKLVALLLAVFVVLAILKADPIGFVIGFKMIFPALAWQAIRTPGHLDGGDDGADDTESS